MPTLYFTHSDMAEFNHLQPQNTSNLSPSGLCLATLEQRYNDTLQAQLLLAEFIANIKDLICKQASTNQLERISPPNNSDLDNKKDSRVHLYRLIVNSAIEGLLHSLPGEENIPTSKLKTALDIIENKFIAKLGYKPVSPEIEKPSDEEVTEWSHQKNPGE